MAIVSLLFCAWLYVICAECSRVERTLIDNHDRDYNGVVDQASWNAMDDRQLVLYSHADSDVYAAGAGPGEAHPAHEDHAREHHTRMQQFIDHFRLHSSLHASSSRDVNHETQSKHPKLEHFLQQFRSQKQAHVHHLITSVENIKEKAIAIEQRFATALPQPLKDGMKHASHSMQDLTRSAVHHMHLIAHNLHEIAEWALHPVHQRWFNFLTGSIENVLVAYIRGAEQWLDAKYSDTFERMKGSIESPPKYIARYIVKIRPKLVSWMKTTVDHIYKPLRQLFRNHMVNAYNSFKLNMAMPQSLQCEEFDFDAENTKYESHVEPKEHASRFSQFVERLFVDKSFGTVCRMLNQVFKIAMEQIKAVVDEKNVEIERNIQDMFKGSRLLSEKGVVGKAIHIKEIKNWVVTKIRAFFVFMTEFCNRAAVGVFNHIKKMIAIGKGIHYNEHELDVQINGDVNITKNIDETEKQNLWQKFHLDPRQVFKRSPTDSPTAAPTQKPTPAPSDYQCCLGKALKKLFDGCVCPLSNHMSQQWLS